MAKTRKYVHFMKFPMHLYHEPDKSKKATNASSFYHFVIQSSKLVKLTSMRGLKSKLP